MSLASEKLIANINFGAIGKAEELKKRIWFTLAALIVYRVGAHITLPGIDPRILYEMFKMHSGNLFDIFDMLSGGSLGRMSIFALNIMPYITASIIMQLLTAVSKNLSNLKKEGEAGRKKIQQYTRYGTVFLASFQGYGIAVFVENSFANAVFEPGIFFRITTVVTLVGGTMFLMWLGEQITARGIGNGISLIIFSGIVAGLPGALKNLFELGRTGALSTGVILFIITLAIGVLYLIVFMERAHRRIMVQYPKRQMGNKMYGGSAQHLPLKLNSAGVIPPIFASSILLFPATIAGFSAAGNTGILQEISIYLGHGKPLYIVAYVAAIAFFCFFYTNHIFNPNDTADNLKKAGGFVPGIRPGKDTSDHLSYILNRITVIGAIYLSFICLVPELLISNYSIPFYLGGTSLLIVVNVTMDTVEKIHSYLIAHQYDGLIKKAKLKGRFG